MNLGTLRPKARMVTGTTYIRRRFVLVIVWELILIKAETYITIREKTGG
jgi:hypothetical protein